MNTKLQVILKTDDENLRIANLDTNTPVENIHAVVHPNNTQPTKMIEKVLKFLQITTTTKNNTTTIHIPEKLSNEQMKMIDNAFRLYSSHKRMLSLLITRYNSTNNPPEGKDKLKQVIHHISTKMNEHLQYLLVDRYPRARNLMSQFSKVEKFTNPKKLSKEQMIQKIERRLKRLPKKELTSIIKSLKN